MLWKSGLCSQAQAGLSGSCGSSERNASLKSEQAKKLNRLIWLWRLRNAAAAALIVVPIALIALWFLWPDPVVSTSEFEGTVARWTRQQSYEGTGKLVATVTLKDGRQVQAVSSGNRQVVAGDTVRLERVEKESGASFYRFAR